MTTEGKLNIPVDHFQYLASLEKDKYVTEEEQSQTDLTQTLWQVLIDKVNNNELNNIGIVGEVRKGKSTVAIYIAWAITRYLDKKHHRPLTDIRKIVFSDQTEFLRFVKTETTHVMICIDEFNALSETGLNSTTEAALFDHYSNVFAGMYVHRIACSPAVLLDKNTTVILKVLGRNDQQQTTRVIIQYRDPVTKDITTIGHADICVKELLDDEYYRIYLRKKYLRMTLTARAGIRDIRELEFSYVVNKCWERISNYARVRDITKGVAYAKLLTITEEEGLIYSELVKNEIVTRVLAITDMLKEVRKIRKELTKKGANTEDLNTALTEAAKLLNSMIHNEQRKATLYERYLDITGTEKDEEIHQLINNKGGLQWNEQQPASNATKKSKIKEEDSSQNSPTTHNYITQTSSHKNNGNSSTSQTKKSHNNNKKKKQ